MRPLSLRLAFALCAVLGGGANAQGEPTGPPVVGLQQPAPGSVLAENVESDWILNANDNVCGLRDPRMLSNPGRINYDTLMAATPELQKLKREGIDPSSAEGIQLKQQAIDRVTKASESVRVTQGHCSVWKAISHKDGRVITDLTELVRGKL
jgi:hypothetical protein